MSYWPEGIDKTQENISKQKEVAPGDIIDDISAEDAEGLVETKYIAAADPAPTHAPKPSIIAAPVPETGGERT